MKVKLLKNVDNIPAGSTVEVKKFISGGFYSYSVPTPTKWEILDIPKHICAEFPITYSPSYIVDQKDFEILD